MIVRNIVAPEGLDCGQSFTSYFRELTIATGRSDCLTTDNTDGTDGELSCDPAYCLSVSSAKSVVDY